MTPYQNLGGNSGVLEFSITEDAIHVVFTSGQYRNYLYDSMRPGKGYVDRMKELAIQGRGLNSFVSSVVKSNYAKKW